MKTAEKLEQCGIADLELDDDSFIAAANYVLKYNKFCHHDFDQLVDEMVAWASECFKADCSSVSCLGINICITENIARAWVDPTLMERA